MTNYYRELSPAIRRPFGLTNLETDTFVIDLTQSWTNQTLVAASQVAQPTNMRTVRQPVLYYDSVNNMIRRYGGWPYIGTDNISTAMPSELWSFEAGSTTVNWTQNTDPSANGLSSDSLGPFAPANAFTNSTFYSFGGNVFAPNALPNMTVLSGLVTEDFSSQTWKNSTVQIPSQNIFRTQSRAVYVPNFGEQGFLVVVGGESPPTDSSFYETGTAMVDMSVITLYEIATDTWYTQLATGDIPPPRSEFCAVGSASSDGQYFEV